MLQKQQHKQAAPVDQTPLPADFLKESITTEYPQRLLFRLFFMAKSK